MSFFYALISGILYLRNLNKKKKELFSVSAKALLTRVSAHIRSHELAVHGIRHAHTLPFFGGLEGDRCRSLGGRIRSLFASLIFFLGGKVRVIAKFCPLSQLLALAGSTIHN